jgi:hypothetical protein
MSVEAMENLLGRKRMQYEKVDAAFCRCGRLINVTGGILFTRSD